jgi:hypothetical protein
MWVGNPPSDRLARPQFHETMREMAEPSVPMERRLLRLLTLVVLFLLALLTGMLVPPSWLAGR